MIEIERDGPPYPLVSEMQQFVNGNELRITVGDVVFELSDRNLGIPLLGREWVYGISDCYEAVRSWFWQVRGLRLDYFPREYGWWEKQELGMYHEFYSTQGFVPIPSSELDEGDVILYRMGGKSISHAAVYTDGQVYGHLLGRKSGYLPQKALHPFMMQVLRYVCPTE